MKICQTQKIRKLVYDLHNVLSVTVTNIFLSYILPLLASIAETEIKLCRSKLIKKISFLASGIRFQNMMESYEQLALEAATANGNYLRHIMR